MVGAARAIEIAKTIIIPFLVPSPALPENVEYATYASPKVPKDIGSGPVSSSTSDWRNVRHGQALLLVEPARQSGFKTRVKIKVVKIILAFEIFLIFLNKKYSPFQRFLIKYSCFTWQDFQLNSLVLRGHTLLRILFL